LVDELGEATVDLMRTIKHAVDPLNLMNPGKVRPSKLAAATFNISTSYIPNRTRLPNPNKTVA
jgi:hypothetical protein